MNYELPEFKVNIQILQKFLQSNILLYCVVMLLILKIISVGVSLNLPFNIFFADITKATLENLANQTRQSLGLDVLINNQKLDQAAGLKAEDMVKNQYFSHTSPTGITPWFWLLQAGYNYKYAGENLAIGFFDSTEVYNAWLSSPSHKENLLNPNYKEIGTAIAYGYGNANTIVVVQLFGSAKTIKTTSTAPVKSAPVKVNPPQKPAEEPKVVLQEPEVLSQSTEAKIQSLDNIVLGNKYTNFVNYVINNYSGLLQDILYGVSLIVIGILIFLIYSSLDTGVEKKLVFRSILIVALLSLSLFVNKEFVTSLIPHQVII